MSGTSCAKAIVPSLIYKDAVAAIKFLCSAFGFKEQLVVKGENEEAIAHAQLELGDGKMVMLSSESEISGPLASHMAGPGKLGGLLCSALYV